MSYYLRADMVCHPNGVYFPKIRLWGCELIVFHHLSKIRYGQKNNSDIPPRSSSTIDFLDDLMNLINSLAASLEFCFSRRF